jgi:hypothetical protein
MTQIHVFLGVSEFGDDPQIVTDLLGISPTQVSGRSDATLLLNCSVGWDSLSFLKSVSPPGCLDPLSSPEAS